MWNHMYSQTRCGEIYLVLLKTLLKARFMEAKEGRKRLTAWKIYPWLKTRVVVPCALRTIHFSTHFCTPSPHYTLSVAPPKSLLHCTRGEARQHGEQQALRGHVFTPDSVIFLCILNGRCWFIIISHLYNSCYLSMLTEIFVTVLDSTCFAWPCNYWKHRCYLWLRQILCSVHLPGCLVICAPEPSPYPIL